jgi:hypothetical protein
MALERIESSFYLFSTAKMLTQSGFYRGPCHFYCKNVNTKWFLPRAMPLFLFSTAQWLGKVKRAGLSRQPALLVAVTPILQLLKQKNAVFTTPNCLCSVKLTWIPVFLFNVPFYQ